MYVLGKVLKNDIIVSDSEAICLGIERTLWRSTMKDFKVVCTPRPGSKFGIDLCFVIDCTGSMDPCITHGRGKAIYSI
jgi:hypothetical protein